MTASITVLSPTKTVPVPHQVRKIFHTEHEAQLFWQELEDHDKVDYYYLDGDSQTICIEYISPLSQQEVNEQEVIRLDEFK